MKKLINNIEDAVVDQLKGVASAHPSLKVNFDPKFITRSESPIKNKVAIVSGGGSGHEPMHGGFVGQGMLDGACPGEVFTSPTPDQMYECAKAVNGGAGVLFLVKNYTGDVMNFEMAAELVHADGIDVQCILIDDDVAVKDSLYTAGRRGVGTTVLMEKIVGAAAEAGYDLDQCADLARKINLHGKSMGMALTSCIVPAAGKPTFDLGAEEIELGIGIHGEPGMKRIPYTTADEIADLMTKEILDDGAYSRKAREWDRASGQWTTVSLEDETFHKGDEVIIMVNSMGGTPVSELYPIYHKVAEVCAARGIKIVRNLVGHYITSLEMQGCSITILKSDEEMLRFWDKPVNTPGLRWGV